MWNLLVSSWNSTWNGISKKWMRMMVVVVVVMHVYVCVWVCIFYKAHGQRSAILATAESESLSYICLLHQLFLWWHWKSGAGSIWPGPQHFQLCMKRHCPEHPSWLPWLGWDCITACTQGLPWQLRAGSYSIWGRTSSQTEDSKQVKVWGTSIIFPC